jgi:hypothetical protein
LHVDERLMSSLGHGEIGSMGIDLWYWGPWTKGMEEENLYMRMLNAGA